MAGPLFRDVPTYPINVSKCEGSCVISRQGRRYIDFIMGWGVGNLGWNNKVIMKAVKTFDGPIYVAPNYGYERWEVLAKKLVSLMPNKSYTCFRATGGTEAVELSLKISKAYNHRKKFIAFNGAYHGQSFECMALVGLHENKYGPYPDHYIRLGTDWEEAKNTAIKVIKQGDVSAFISEPIICNLGVIVPPKSFFEELKEACEETDTLFIMDEVVTGFGRTGNMFGFQHYDIRPDIITIAKGFSSGHAPIGSAIAINKVAESMKFDFSNYSTFGWHPLAVECAIENIRQIDSGLLGNVKKSGKLIMNSLSEFCNPEGKGLCIGFDVEKKNFEAACLKDGLLLSVIGDRAVLFPALNVAKKDIDNAVKIIGRNY